MIDQIISLVEMPENHILCEAEQWACVLDKLLLPLSDLDLLLL